MKKRFLTAALALCLALSLFAVAASAAGEELTIDGKDYSGSASDEAEGWAYDAVTKTLTLDGYVGGPIQTEGSLTVVLAAGSTNKITSRYDPGTKANRAALGSNEFGYDDTKLSIYGESGGERPELIIDGDLMGVYCQGDITVENCRLKVDILSTEKSEPVVSSGTRSNYVFACLRAGGGMDIRNAFLELGSHDGVDGSKVLYVGMSAATGELKIEDSFVTVDADYTGIQSSNESLSISGSRLDVRGDGTAALVCQRSGITLKDCTGTLYSEGSNGIGITAQSRADSVISVTDCDLDIYAAYYGVMNLYYDVKIEDSDIGFPGTDSYRTRYGLYGNAIDVIGESELSGERCYILARSPSQENWEEHIGDEAGVDGVLSTDKMRLCFAGTLTIDNELTSELSGILGNQAVSVELLPGADISIPEGVVLNASRTKEVVNCGRVVNYGELYVATGGLQNAGEAVSVCTWVIPVAEGGNAVKYEHDWNEGKVTKQPTYTEEGVMTFTCWRDNSHTYTAPIPVLPEPEPEPVLPDPEPVREFIPKWLNTDDHFAYMNGYPDGGIRPDANISRAEAAAIIFRLLDGDALAAALDSVSSYSDVSAESWYGVPVATLENLGVFTGYPDGTFRPDESMSRAEFAALLTRFFDYEAEYAGAFGDVSAESWYADYVQAAHDIGLIEGYGGEFRPAAPVTRAEAAAIVNRALGRVPHAEHLLPEGDMRLWSDNPASAWYYAHIQEATNGHDYKWVLHGGTLVESWREAR